MIKGYQWVLPPLLGPACRFYPSCSEYAHEAIRRHGLRSGSILAVKRVLRCHPWHPGGLDPVPEVVEQRKYSGGDTVRKNSPQ